MLSFETRQRVRSMSSTALIVIDFTKQNSTHDVPQWGLTLNKVRAIQPNIEKLVSHSRQQGIPIIWIGTSEWISKNLPDNINALYRSNSNAAFYKEGEDQFLIEPDSDDTVFYKNTYSAFSGTKGQLEKFLNLHGII